MKQVRWLLVVVAIGIGVVACVDHSSYCGSRQTPNLDDGYGWCDDENSPQYHLSSLDCSQFATDTFKPAWCEPGCAPGIADNGPSCFPATNPWWDIGVTCTSTRTVNGVSGCCLSQHKDQSHGLNSDAVMFFACH